MFVNSKYKDVYSIVFNSDDTWSNDNFTIQKAYAASKLSKLAYTHIPEFEQSSLKRTKVIPCNTYQYLVRISKGNKVSINDHLENVVFIIEDVNYIVLGIKINNILHITIRGTVNSHDWLVNLNRKKLYNDGKRYHRGFYLEAEQLFREVEIEYNILVEKRIIDKYSKVVFTGHSLGGAIASILYLMWTESCSKECFTIGMPKFEEEGEYSNIEQYDLSELFLYRKHHHIFYYKDIVTSLPFTYKYPPDTINEYVINKNGLLKYGDDYKYYSFIKKLTSIANLKKNHSIDNYVTMLENIYCYEDEIN